MRGVALRARVFEISYYCGCLVIALVSVHDAILIVVNHEVIGEVERNPIGSWLLDVAEGSVWLFVLLKLLLTSIVVTFLVFLFYVRRELAWIVMPPIVLFQLCLLGYLTFA